MTPIKLNREKELETILTLCVALIVFFFFTGKQHAWMLTLSFVLGFTGLFLKTVASKISWAWLKLGELMGSVMSKVILSIVFFVFLFPIALISRLSKKTDVLQLQKKNDGNSYYTSRNHQYTAKDLENVW